MFGFLKNQKARRNSTKKSGRRAGKAVLAVESLERRDLMSINNLWFSGATLVLAADNNATSVEVRQSGANINISEVGSGRSWSYAASSVSAVQFQGGAGNDRFVDYVANLAVQAYGFGGDDYLEGYNAADMFVGGEGNDTLVGYGGDDRFYGGPGNDILRGMAGNDQLSGEDGNDQIEGNAGNDIEWGGNGNDVLLGHDGNDQLVGGEGNDQLNGQAGADKLWGGNGNDVLIAIDAAIADYVQSDDGNDIMWIDQNGNYNDTVSGATSSDKVQYVNGFANGADRTLNGDRIADPAAAGGQVYKQFSGRPLFAASGPAANDVRQGGIGDCWLLAGAAAIANDRPAAIRENVVDFNDGTYGVHLGSSFYRVDNDLPVYNADNTTPANAQMGQENSMWVAVIEKAYAHYRNSANSGGLAQGTNSYLALEGGWSVEVIRAFNSSAPGERDMQSYGSATALANEIFNRWNNYENVTIGFLGGSGASIVTGHMYTVMSVSRNAAGVVTSITLRNPWGVDGGGSTDANPNDGLVTVTPAQIFGYVGRLNWGRV